MKEQILTELNRRIEALGEEHRPNIYSSAREWKEWAIRIELQSLVQFVEALSVTPPGDR